METKKNNLFVGDRSFSQNWTLSFKEKGTERKFLAESLKFHKQSLQYIYAWTVLIWVYFYYIGKIEATSLLVSLVVLAASLYPQDIYIKRSLLQILCLIWETHFLSQGNISETFGIFFPSFVLNFFMLKSWTKSSLFYLSEIVIICFIGKSVEFLPNLIISALTYILIISTLEKDFRDLWHLYASYKKSNNLNKALWDTFPGAELIISPEGKILFYNRSAVDILKSQGKSLDILKGGNFEDFFDDFADQARNVMTKAMKGEPNEEVYVSKDQKNEWDSGEESYMVVGDMISWVTGNCVRVFCLDVSKHTAKKSMILFCFKDLQGYLDIFSKNITQSFALQTPVTKESVTILSRIMNYFRGTMIIQSHFTGLVQLCNENFDVNSEIFNVIEFLYLKICNHNLSVIYTREKGIPSSIIGDKSLHNVIVFSILDYVIENSIDGSEVFILVQVSVMFT